jgi:hypothetical protein
VRDSRATAVPYAVSYQVTLKAAVGDEGWVRVSENANMHGRMSKKRSCEGPGPCSGPGSGTDRGGARRDGED